MLIIEPFVVYPSARPGNLFTVYVPLEQDDMMRTGYYPPARRMRKVDYGIDWQLSVMGDNAGRCCPSNPYASEFWEYHALLCANGKFHDAFDAAVVLAKEILGFRTTGSACQYQREPSASSSSPDFAVEACLPLPSIAHHSPTGSRPDSPQCCSGLEVPYAFP